MRSWRNRPRGRREGRCRRARAAHLVRHAEHLVSEGRTLSRPNCEGVERQPNPPKTYVNTQENFASDNVHGKASATMQAGAALYLRAVGDMLRWIGGRE